MKGILLLSVGNPYYIRMAYQLAYSIKCMQDIQIAIAQNNINFLNEEQKKVFDIIIDCPNDIIEDKKYIRAKTHLYDLSPFDETIFLDSDMLALNVKKFSELFEELKGVDFTIANRGRSDLNVSTDATTMWGNLKEVKEFFKIENGWWYQLSSEFIYFKKCEKAKKVFDKAKEIFDSQIPYKKFADGMADEFAFGISCMINNIYPHQENFTPIYWAHATKRFTKPIDPHINENYYGYSMGGAYATQQQKGFYDNMLAWYQQTSKKYIDVFPAQSKSRYIESRKSI